MYTLCDKCKHNDIGTGCKKNVVDSEEYLAGVSQCFLFSREVDFMDVPDGERAGLEREYNNSRGV